ncbi:CHAT domain-containing protein [Streptomyces sp. Tu102]|uniref:CHAT domain-containing protein n=1 Tax=Streptomyces TaxID=1883 RepID=UPI001BDD1786|nr:CHAT domain-containing protein [Streptomyces sp. Tu102]
MYRLRLSVGVAGARTLVMSLWHVPDREAQELMGDFYGRLTRGEPRGSAFLAARLAMRAPASPIRTTGAFICQATPGRCPRTSSATSIGRRAPGRVSWPVGIARIRCPSGRTVL